jgi:hypothetical protein
MTIYFLDYYHPYAGLCNQLYLITNHIHDAYNKGVELFINKFNVDIFNKKRVPVEEVIDINKTNENILNLCGKKILKTECPETDEYIPRLCIYPVSSIEFLNCLEFHGSILSDVNKLKSIFPNGYYSIHFRLDIDAIIHYTFGKEVYNEFMDLCNNSPILAKEFFNTLNKEKIEKYCNFLMHQYFLLVKHFGFDKTWYISTSITKDNIHEPMKIYLNLLTNYILDNKGVYYIPPKIYQERELNALVDLLVLRDSEKMIGFEGSSFSEGYCLKVNSIRKVTKEYLFVKEYNI